MTKRKTILILVVCGLIAALVVQPLSQARSLNPTGKPPDPERQRNMTEEERESQIEKRRRQQRLELERLRNMTEQERKRELTKRRRQRDRQRELDRQRKQRELEKKSAERRQQKELLDGQRKVELEKRHKEWERKKEEAGGFMFAKCALGATEEQWKIIRTKLEKVKHLRERASSVVGARVTRSSGSRAGARANVPAFQWKRPWKDRAPGELTESQKLTKQLIALVERENTTPEAFRRKMDALRKARSKEAEIEGQLSDVHRELREILTTRQEAALVLMKWL